MYAAHDSGNADSGEGASPKELRLPLARKRQGSNDGYYLIGSL